jgi:hypothetical protein
VQVPDSDWHCATCAERLAANESLSHGFDSTEQYRSREVEDELMDQLLCQKAGVVETGSEVNGISFDCIG